MGLKVYLPVAVAVFLVATAGADLVARTSIGGQPFAAALHEHLYWAAVELVGTALLLAPFIAVAFVCARIEKQARDRSVALIFTAAMLALLYFYFQGYQASERAMLQKMWTAATLSVGLLPFFIGVPVVLAALGAGAVAAKFDRRMAA
jgi:heme/copper-type cytochrome/quinol oxidase subunit 3